MDNFSINKELRIYLQEDQIKLTTDQKENLFWLKEGYLCFYCGFVKGEFGARTLAFLQCYWPVKEIGAELTLSECFEKSEEAFYVNKIGEVVSIYQIGKISIGKVRLTAKKLRDFWQQN